MTARSIWQGTLSVQKQQIPVKLYSAVLDRQIHFHLLHKRDHTRVAQRMVDAETEKPVPPDEARKAFEAEPGVYVAVTREELEETAPKPDRKIGIDRFVPVRSIDAQLFDRPYYLGPTEQSTVDYSALLRALDAQENAGIATWVMRKHSYVGAVVPRDGWLMLITLRHAEEVIPVTELDPPAGRALEPKERELADRLIEALSGEFQPEAYRDEYQERVRELIDAKRAGKKVKPRRAPRRRAEGTLAHSLQSSLNEVTRRRRG
jgi:DNA end-binding protein Ku